ncbi:MAG: hypothetical protein IAB19_09730 [Proteobacteria bacterium]|uniref:Uncharacterized protein n=1 Tax=Candidatus Avisuccinivibrio stercorigallinarum TaxID=2840704 RepID=A0A9D9GTL1_9GAMM|nr:hypothetical protein [Candidatus Avisuccinivibrio stercorigallinarum]
MKKALALGLLFCAFSASSEIVINDSCLKCKSIVEDGEFKACLVDCLSPGKEEIAKVEKQKVDAKKAGWLLNASVDEMTDRSIRVASKKSENGFDYIMNTVYPTLAIIQTSENEKLISVYFSPAKVLGGFANNVTIRIDKNEAMTVEAVSTGDGEALSIGSEELEQQMKTGNRCWSGQKFSVLELRLLNLI